MSYVAHLEVRVRVAAPAEQVWSELVDWDRQGAWMVATDVRRDGAAASGVADGVGTELLARTGFGAAGFTDAMVITAWEPPRRCEVLHHGSLLRGDGGFAVRADEPGHSTLTWWERIALPGPATLLGAGWLLARRPVRGLLRRSLRRFADLVEESNR